MYRYFNILSFSYALSISLSILSLSCDCNNPKDKQPSSNNTRKPTSDLPSPSSKKPDQSAAIKKAIHDLEKEIDQPNADPTLEKIYKVFKLLPPLRAVRNSDGSYSRFSPEKSGMELFEKILENLIGHDATSEAVAWLIDKNLLGPNELDEQGNSPLEKVITAQIKEKYPDIIQPNELAAIRETLLEKGAKLPAKNNSEILENLIQERLFKDKPKQHHIDIFNFLINQNATLSQKTSTRILEKLIEKRFIKKEPQEHHKNIFNFLITQKPALGPRTASILLDRLIFHQVISIEGVESFLDLAKFLQNQGGIIWSEERAMELLGVSIKFARVFLYERNPLKKESDAYIFDTLTKSIHKPVNQERVTELLKQAVEKELGIKLYLALIELGANTYIEIEIPDNPGTKISLLQYINERTDNEDFKALLKALTEKQ